MKPILVLLLGLAALRASPISSQGDLVDANCFQSEERNVNPNEINLTAARDLGFEVRACYPRANKTKTFVVVLSSGEIFALDTAGNTQAARLVEAAGKPRERHRFGVNITGTISDKTIRVDSISALQ